MRARSAILLVALFAVIAFVGVVVVPSEALMVEKAGSVVDQVASCRQASGLAREAGRGSSFGETCRLGGVVAQAGVVVAVIVTAAGALGLLDASRVRRRRERWTLPDAVARAGAPRRAPPLAV